MQAETPGPGAGGPPGLFDSVKKIAATLLAIGHTRLELLSAELEEERAWTTSLLMWTLTALFCAAVAVVFGTLLVVVLFWEANRERVLAVLAIVFFVAAAIAWYVVWNMAKARPRLFSASLAELAKDRERLVPSHERETDRTR